MRIATIASLVLTGLFATQVVHADTEITGTITKIEIVANGNAADKILVYGTFSPAMGCTKSAFMLLSTDSYFAQSYALLLAAHMSGATIKVMHSYCAGDYGRANSYAVVR